jgi:hypothetical protein
MWVAVFLVGILSGALRRRHLRRVLRNPVPLMWVAVAVLCWAAST